MNNLHLPNTAFAQFMTVNNTVAKMQNQISAIGLEAVEQIRHLIPQPTLTSEERYIEFPDDGEITVHYPLVGGGKSLDPYRVKRIYITKRQEVRVECYERRGVSSFPIENLGTAEIINLLDKILKTYGQV